MEQLVPASAAQAAPLIKGEPAESPSADADRPGNQPNGPVSTRISCAPRRQELPSIGPTTQFPPAASIRVTAESNGGQRGQEPLSGKTIPPSAQSLTQPRKMANAARPSNNDALGQVGSGRNGAAFPPRPHAFQSNIATGSTAGTPLSGQAQVQPAPVTEPTSVKSRSMRPTIKSLLAAVRSGDWYRVGGIIDQKVVDVNALSARDSTALQLAARLGQLETCELLISRGKADPNLSNGEGWTPLLFAVDAGKAEVVALLVKYGALPDKGDNEGWTPLMLAAAYGHTLIAKCLIDAQADVDLFNKRGSCPILLAADKGHANMVGLLLRKGKADPNISKGDGWTPLMYGADGGNVKVCSLLLKHGAQVDCVQLNGWTPLMFAAHNGHTDVVELLVMVGAANVYLVQEEGATSLMLAAERGNIGVAGILLNKGNANVNQGRNDGWTALMFACQEGYLKVAELLVAKGNADANQADALGWTSLTAACHSGHINVAKMLVERGNASVNAVTKQGTTPLILCTTKDIFELAEFLLATGSCNIDLADEGGWTALMVAAYHGNLRFCKLFIKSGANMWPVVTDADNNRGKRAFELARSRGHHSCASFLEGAMLMQSVYKPSLALSPKVELDQSVLDTRAKAVQDVVRELLEKKSGNRGTT